MIHYLNIDFYNDAMNPIYGTQRTQLKVVKEPDVSKDGLWFIVDVIEDGIKVKSAFRLNTVASFFYFTKPDSTDDAEGVAA